MSLETTERKLRAELRKTRGGVAWQVPVAAAEDAAARVAHGEAEAEVDEPASNVGELIRLRHAIACVFTS